MKIFFQIRMESRILGIPNEEIAPQKDNPTYISNEAQPEIRDFYDEWLVAQTEKVRAYIDDVKFQNAINTAKMAIKDQRFEKCSKKISRAYVEDAPVEETIGKLLDEKECLTIKIEDMETEALVYQMLGYVYGEHYKQYVKSVRCLNRAYRLGQDHGSA